MSAATQPGGDVRPASTLVPLRDSARGLEILMTVRPKSLRFMGGATVFPGGAVAAADADERWERASSISSAQAAAALGEFDERAALAAYVCALREAFEEVGLLLGEGPLDSVAPEDAASPESFLEICQEKGIVLATDKLYPAGRWVTPLGSPIRFDARFFVAAVPPGWSPRINPREVAECRWVTAEEALEDFSESRAVMAPPTVEMLQLLRNHGSIEVAVEAVARNKVGQGGFIFRAPVAPNTEVVLAPNPSVMTGPGTNTYVVGTGPRAVIDPAVADTDYLDTVMDAAGEIELVLVTHRHSDHVGGIEQLVSRTGAPVRAWGPEPAGGIEVDPIENGESIEVPGARLVAMHTPGHAPDHLCFHMDEHLFAGDNILGEGTSVIAPPDGSMSDYLQSLRRLRALPVKRILTGHFRPLDDAHSVIDDYVEHRQQRERLIVEALAPEPRAIAEIVERAYSDTPEHLHSIAQYSALAHLEMLEANGVAEQLPDGWRLKVIE